MLLIVSDDAGYVANTIYYNNSIYIFSDKKYGIIDSVTGKLVEIKSGKKIIAEIKEARGKGKPIKYANFHDAQLMSFYDIGVSAREEKYCSNSDILYQYVNICNKDLKVLNKTFDEMIISIFKCADSYYLRINTWLFPIYPSIANASSLGETYLQNIRIGGAYFAFTGSTSGDIQSKNCYIVIGLSCIHHYVDEHALYFNFTTAQYDNQERVDSVFRRYLSHKPFRLDLESGILSVSDNKWTVQGEDIDLFNRNLIFGTK